MEYVRKEGLNSHAPTAPEFYTKNAFEEMGIENCAFFICPENGLSANAIAVLGEGLTDILRRVIDQSTISGFSPQILDELYSLAPEVHNKINAVTPDSLDFIPEDTFHAEVNDSVVEIETQAGKVNRSIYAAHKSFMPPVESSDANISQNRTVRNDFEKGLESSAVVHWSNQDAKSKVPRGPGRKEFKKSKGHGTIFSAQSSGLFSPPAPRR
jgi:hypothetical protein